jgi:hypothetical protein
MHLHTTDEAHDESPRTWGEQHAAWQHGAEPRAGREPLPMGVLVKVCEHRRVFGRPRPHARDAAGCNWTIDPLHGDIELQRRLALLRGTFDLVA